MRAMLANGTRTRIYVLRIEIHDKITLSIHSKSRRHSAKAKVDMQNRAVKEHNSQFLASRKGRIATSIQVEE
jgi:hypothetical protein